MTPTTNGGSARIGSSPAGTARLLSIPEAAALSGLSVRAIQQAIQGGDLPVVEVQGESGREYRLPADAADGLASGQQEAALQLLQRRRAMGHPFSRFGRLRIAGGVVLLAILALVTAAVPAAVYHTASARAYATVPQAHPSVDLDTTFTLTVLRKPSGRRITIKGHVNLSSGITPALLSVLEGCPLPTARAGVATGGAAAGASMGLAQVSASPTLPVSLLQRLQQWGTAYSVVLSLDQARVSGVTAG